MSELGSLVPEWISAAAVAPAFIGAGLVAVLLFFLCVQVTSKAGNSPVGGFTHLVGFVSAFATIVFIGGGFGLGFGLSPAGDEFLFPGV